MLEIIHKGIENNTASIAMPLHKSVVRSHLEYCVWLWSHHFEEDIAELERVKKGATKMIQGLKNKECMHGVENMDRYLTLGTGPAKPQIHMSGQGRNTVPY